MRIFFNHGLTAEEIYTNTQKNIIDKNWKWFITRYGSTNSYSDAISDPFKYCFGLALHKVIDEKKRFKIPYASNGFIDFEIVQGDKFIEHRQNGRFQEIDFVGSDFTGYALRYYFNTKSYQKSYPIYIGGELKKKFILGINSGIKYNTIKDFTVDDLLEEVNLKFKDLTKKEIKKLLIHGFRRMHSAIKFGCAITINTTKFINCYAYIGNLTLVPDKQIKDYSYRKNKKLRKIYSWKKEEFDGYYYIGLNPTAFEQWVKNNKTSRNTLKFDRVLMRKLKEELYNLHKHVYIFRVPIRKFKGWAFWADKLNKRDIEFIGESYEYKFTETTKTWKEIIKEYATTSN